MNKVSILAASMVLAFNVAAQQIFVEQVQQAPAATAQAAANSTPAPTMQQRTVDGQAITDAIKTINDPSNPSYVNSVASQYDQQFAQQPQESEREKFAKKIAEKWKPTQTFDLLPSENIVIPVARGLMNSIATNFKMLSARSSDEQSIIEVEQGYLYVTINSDQPVGFILYEEGVMDSQISVTLWPIDVPASIVKLDVSMSEDMKQRAADYRKTMELEEKQAQALAQEDTAANKSNDHTKKILSLLTPVAQGDLPRGFTMTNDIPAHYLEPCQVAIKQIAGQRLSGGREVIDVVLMTNDSNRTYHVREEMCLSAGVKAVSVFEKAYLQPGEQTEVYILRDKLYELDLERKNRRPRLTGVQNDKFTANTERRLGRPGQAKIGYVRWCCCRTGCYVGWHGWLWRRKGRQNKNL